LRWRSASLVFGDRHRRADALDARRVDAAQLELARETALRWSVHARAPRRFSPYNADHEDRRGSVRGR
jgi:hypothetical protein